MIYITDLPLIKKNKAMKIIYLTPIICLLIIGCSSTNKLPKTLGEENTTFSYIPIDPLPVSKRPGVSCESNNTEYKELLKALPDQAVRLATAQMNGAASGSFGPVTVGYKNNTYQVVLDYINVDATQLPIYVKKIINEGERKGEVVPLYDNSIKSKVDYIIKSAPRINPNSENNYEKNSDKGDLIIIPVYIGVGLRLTATIFVSEGKANLSSLGAIAAEAEAGKITGTLTVQTLGITGKSVATSLPLPSEINQTTIQNAILSLGSIKAVLYDKENTILNPRVVGVYNPIGGGKQVMNGIISALAEEPITWYRPCKEE